ncbi:hypothetical protein VC83_05133 [Pseudogymnoascus destructans]|uniref:Uncharacterized protein n=1 Tax=Pseudogymnoascus destructans TaxID=655981 RepID=A0A177ABM7_9PEZI|nr:uncharacterized protein VC83_05133 [Pseudogymnoascus destructans]OAF58583.1 hypothetical protein VC83_05133 [Pseudogymnoascus destructans]
MYRTNGVGAKASCHLVETSSDVQLEIPVVPYGLATVGLQLQEVSAGFGVSETASKTSNVYVLAPLATSMYFANVQRGSFLIAAAYPWAKSGFWRDLWIREYMDWNLFTLLRGVG